VLETIERGTANSDHPSLLFVHGYWQAAWTWDEFVMPALAERGHHCVALSLRGHGESDGRIRGSSIGDYVADVQTVVETLGGSPVIVGHSMGGFVTQHYLARGYSASAAILVSPVPRKGAWGATFRVARRHPWRFLKTNATLDVGAVVETPQAARDFLVSSHLPDDFIMQYMPRLERASYRVYVDLLLNRPDLRSVDIPAIVLGGTDDGFFTELEWSDTARELGAHLEMLQGIGHQPMWEGEGVALTESISRFVETLR
jgi:pimeloyl-ACP methyl ester carboxylesterase